jgi:hypothetical protein
VRSTKKLLVKQDARVTRLSVTHWQNGQFTGKWHGEAFVRATGTKRAACDTEEQPVSVPTSASGLPVSPGVDGHGVPGLLGPPGASGEPALPVPVAVTRRRRPAAEVRLRGPQAVGHPGLPVTANVTVQ